MFNVGRKTFFASQPIPIFKTVVPPFEKGRKDQHAKLLKPFRRLWEGGRVKRRGKRRGKAKKFRT
jgi:hypothetical protein